jgi:hypothetical protein
MYRPKTRGELKDCLKKGIPCEVVGYVAEMTATMLRGWLKFDKFTIAPSETYGWVVFEPKKEEGKTMAKCIKLNQPMRVLQTNGKFLNAETGNIVRLFDENAHEFVRSGKGEYTDKGAWKHDREKRGEVWGERKEEDENLD